MSQTNDEKNSKKAEQRGKAAERRLRRANVHIGEGAADWSGVDGQLLATATAAVARNGGAIRYGYTRDGGAYAIGYYGDGEPFTEYVKPGDDMDEYLKGVIEDYGK